MLRWSPLLSVVASLWGCGSPFAPARDPHLYFREQTRTACEEASILRFVNEPSIDAQVLKDVGVHPTGADQLIARRNGLDGHPGTPDDHPYTSVAAIDAVPWIGQSSIDAMYAFAARTCDFVADPEEVCVETTLTDWLSSPDTSEQDLVELGVAARPARELVGWRVGPDGVGATHDDRRYESLLQIDQVPQVGPETMGTLTDWSRARCQLKAEVVFGPAPWGDSHLASVVWQLDHARRSVDLVLGDLSDPYVLQAIDRNARRGVKMRAILDRAAQDRWSPAGTPSGWLEEMGVEVRWLDEAVGHAFALIDGPTEHPSQAGDSVLITGSAQWTEADATSADGAVLLLYGDARAALQHQAEFDLLWSNARLLIWNESIPERETTPIHPDAVFAADGSTALFTSVNFEPTYGFAGPDFRSPPGANGVRDALVQLVHQADRSVWIAASQLRHRPLVDALLAKRAQDPSVEIRVLLDDGEYLPPEDHAAQRASYATCVQDAPGVAALQACDDRSGRMGAELFHAGIPVRYQVSGVHHDPATARPLLHTAILVDGEILATGGADLSPEGERQAMGGLLLLHAGQHPQVLADTKARLGSLWELGRADEQAAYWDLLDLAFTPGADVPLVFPAMALTHDELWFLHDVMASECPLLATDAYRVDPASFPVCPR